MLILLFPIHCSNRAIESWNIYISDDSRDKSTIYTPQSWQGASAPADESFMNKVSVCVYDFVF